MIYSGGYAEYRLPPVTIFEAFSLGKLNLNTDNPRSNPPSSIPQFPDSAIAALTLGSKPAVERGGGADLTPRRHIQTRLRAGRLSRESNVMGD